MSELLSYYSPPRPLRSQNSGHLIIPRIPKSTAGGRSFFYLAPKLWNNLPNTVREADTLCQFKSRLGREGPVQACLQGGLLQQPDYFLFSCSVVDLLVCLGSLSSYITQFWPNFNYRTDGLTIDFRMLCNTPPGPVATKQAQNHQPSTSMLDFWDEVFVLICSLGFHQSILARHLHCGLICSNVIVLEVLWFVQM